MNRPVVPRAGVQVRPAVEGDLEAIVRIERDSFSEPWSRRSFAELMRARRTVFLVAASESAVVGYAVMLTAADEAELANLAVDSAARLQGIGRELLVAVLDRARALRVRTIFLEVRISNLAAQSLYRSAGFREIARRRQYYRQPLEDALVMRLQTADESLGHQPPSRSGALK